ncbi:unnamed protein product [Cylindrotheca closterium]|uniref:Secreted protein n=1 Tax=Cylindrotheca closterium TaxID=2856 RepID=A0AAD2CBW6_9STRA|nr:unnamed protein product [Cylindrotheca closterium]
MLTTMLPRCLMGLVYLLLLSLLPCAASLTQKSAQKNIDCHGSAPRRSVLMHSLQAIAFASVVDAKPALALKERNEALCGTGFFTNIAQYMCTDIGDISDEGKSRKVTDSELSSMDSLLGKLGATETTESMEPEQTKDETKNSSKK